MKNKNKQLNKILSLTLVFSFLITVFNTKEAYAHDAYYLDCSIDAANMSYMCQAVQDKPKKFFGTTDDEKKHKELVLINTEALINNTDSLSFNYESLKPVDYGNGSLADQSGQTLEGSKTRLLTFPDTKDTKTEFKDADETDFAKVQAVIAGPGNSAAQLISLATNNRKLNTVPELIKKGEEIVTLLENGTAVTTTYADSTVTLKSIKEKDGFTTFKQTVKYKDGYQDEYEITLQTEMDRGYNTTKIKTSNLIMQAHYMYVVQNVTASNNRNIVMSTSLVERQLNQAIENGMNSLLSFFQLKTINQLVLGQKPDWDTNEYLVGTTLPTTAFNDIIWIYVMFVVLFLMSFGIIIGKALFEINTKKGDPAALTSFKELALRIIQTNLLLFFILPLIFVGLLLVSIFQNSIVEIVGLSELNATDAAIAGGDSIMMVVMGLGNLVLSIYFNFIYILRNIMLLIFIVISPVVLTLFALGKKEVLDEYLKELAYYIFMPLIYLIPLIVIKGYAATMTSWIEKFAAMFSIILVAESIRHMLFRNAASKLQGFGVGGTFMAMAAASKVSNLAGNGAANLIGNGEHRVGQDAIGTGKSLVSMAAMGMLDTRAGAMAGMRNTSASKIFGTGTGNENRRNLNQSMQNLREKENFVKATGTEMGINPRSTEMTNVRREDIDDILGETTTAMGVGAVMGTAISRTEASSSPSLNSNETNQMRHKTTLQQNETGLRSIERGTNGNNSTLKYDLNNVTAREKEDLGSLMSIKENRDNALKSNNMKGYEIYNEQLERKGILDIRQNGDNLEIDCLNKSLSNSNLNMYQKSEDRSINIGSNSENPSTVPVLDVFNNYELASFKKYNPDIYKSPQPEAPQAPQPQAPQQPQQKFNHFTDHNFQDSVKKEIDKQQTNK